MCLIIQIENVISNYFASNAGEMQVSLTTLGVYKERIERKFRKEKSRFVFINYTNSSLMNALASNPGLFDLDKGNIVHIKHGKHKTLIKEMNFFNSKLPRSIKEDYLNIFASVNSETYESAHP